MTPASPIRHVLLVSDVIGATQQISFLRPLDGVMRVTSLDLKSGEARDPALLDRLRPDLLVLSRATARAGLNLILKARALGIPSIFHIDDNLLAVPMSLGRAKYEAYNAPERLAALRANMDAADLVYVSTPELARQLTAAGITAPITAGRIYCALAGSEIPALCPPRSAVPVIGYMGTSGHGADLALVAPAIRLLMDRRPDLRMEIFGGLEVPEALAAHADRIALIPATRTYDDYLRRLLSLGWWVGLAPLEDNAFNRCKADTKWVEYARAGIPVLASDLPVYRFACAEGAGRLVGTDPSDWAGAMAELLDRPEAGAAQVAAARARLAAHYDLATLRRQLLEVFDLAVLRRRRPETPVPALVAGHAPPEARPAPPRQLPRHLLLIANGLIPTLQLSFLKPLAPLVASGALRLSLVTEAELIAETGEGALNAEGADWMRRRIMACRPDAILCCRYSGPHADGILHCAGDLGVPVIAHVDDDLLNIPITIGAAKFKSHNSPRKLLTVRTLLAQADLVYCSTAALERRLRQQGMRGPVRHGAVYCTSRVLREPRSGPVRRLGYMGFDHAHDFEIARPAIEAVLEAHDQIEFELFGSIPMPQSFLRFGARARSVAPVRDYQAFLATLAAREWDIGICPLARTPFNAVKANTKWIEYTAAGMAVVASSGMVYDHCMRGGRGLLVDDGEWREALELLIARPALTEAMARASQRRLLAEYSETVLRDQVLDVLDEAMTLHQRRRHTPALAGRIRTAA